VEQLFVWRAIKRLITAFTSLCTVRVPQRRITPCTLAPLIVVLPFVVYTYIFLSVYASRIESYERYRARLDLDTLRYRLNDAISAVSLQCRDYAYWDQAYEQVIQPDPKWIESDIVNGIASPAFGYEIVVLASIDGTLVFKKGLTEQIARELINRYQLLESRTIEKERAGVAVLVGRLYVLAARPVLKSDQSGPPRGIFLIARPMDSELLNELQPGTGHRVAAYLAGSGFIEPKTLGLPTNRPESLLRISRTGALPNRKMIDKSKDGLILYGYLPIMDLNNHLVGMLIDVQSKAQLVQNLHVVRSFSLLVMALSAFIGVIGVGLLRHRSLVYRAHRDELTGLYNHGYLQEYLKNQIQLAERHGRVLSAIMLDIDHFKYINDAYGHRVGDAALKMVSQTILATVRTSDVVARYGGEEFVVICPETESAQAAAVAERIRAAVEAKVFTTELMRTSKHTPPASIHITISAGVATYPSDGTSCPELLDAADAALKVAKRTRNKVSVYREINPAAGKKRTDGLDAFLRDSSITTIKPLIAAIEARDPCTTKHSQKAAEYAAAIAREMGFSTYDTAIICKAALLHDIGMISVPDNILIKEDELTNEEMELIRQHPTAGAAILAQSPQLSQLAEIVLYHHEQWDGNGYPSGLRGEEIPLMARVVSVAGSIDSMLSPRSYKRAMTIEETKKELIAQSGKQFDPDVVRAALRVLEAIEAEEEKKKTAA